MPPSEHELRLRERLGRLRNLPLLGGAKLSGELERLQRQIARIGEEATDEEIWRKVELARHDQRPYTLDYVERLLDDWFELHGDRALGDDGAMIAGLGKLDGRTVVLVGQQKGRDIHERASRRFGMPNPEGYRKAMARDGARRPARLPGRHARGHAGRVPGRRRRAARAGRRDRALAGGDGPADGADRGLRDRRGRLRRRDRDRARRPRPHAGERDLLRHLARGLRGDPLARRRPGEEGGRRVPARRGALPRARRDRRHRARAGRAAPTSTTTWRPGCSERRCARRSPSSTGSRATSCAAAAGPASARSASSPEELLDRFTQFRRSPPPTLSTASTGLSPPCIRRVNGRHTTRGRENAA